MADDGVMILIRGDTKRLLLGYGEFDADQVTELDTVEFRTTDKDVMESYTIVRNALLRDGVIPLAVMHNLEKVDDP